MNDPIDCIDHQLEETEKALTRAIALLRAWVAGCGDEHFSTKEQCRELMNSSATFLQKFPLP